MNHERVTKERAADTADLDAYLPLLSEIGDLKRVRAAQLQDTVAAELFHRFWTELVDGAEPTAVARAGTAAALCAARLGAVDAAVLSSGGLSDAESEEVLLAGFDAVASPLPEELRESLRGSVGELDLSPAHDGAPGFVRALARQPRAGATRPGQPRLMLEPPESHAEHCATVAVYGVTLSGAFGADPGPVFVAGLAHHLHNAGLPDSGFTGEQLLGGYLDRVADRFRESALAELPEASRKTAASSLNLTENAESPEARAFHAADVLDRVLQMRNYERQAGFTLDQALEEMELVHPGPLKDFQDAVLSRAGIR